MSNILNNKQYFTSEKFKREWSKTYSFKSTPLNKEEIIEHLKDLEYSNFFPNQMIIFFETKTFIPIYVTKNIETHLGYTQAEFLNWGKNALYNIGGFEQEDFWEDFMNWFKDFFPVDSSFDKSIFKSYSYYGGRKYRHKDGSIKKYLLRTENIHGENAELPDFNYVIYEEISHLLKGDQYWVFFIKETASGSVSKIYTKDKIGNYAISDREKEVLKLIASGMTSKEIAEKLFISPETVTKHRKNMLKRLSARETSSLVQICRMCNII